MPTPNMNAKEQQAYDEALRRIDECLRKAIPGTGLDLAGLGLTRLPPEIGKFTAQPVLVLEKNKLTTLPQEIDEPLGKPAGTDLLPRWDKILHAVPAAWRMTPRQLATASPRRTVRPRYSAKLNEKSLADVNSNDARNGVPFARERSKPFCHFRG